MQKFSSRGTSINSAKLPKVYSKVSFFPTDIVLDYGCGKFTSHIRDYLGNVEYLPFDPFNQTNGVNANSLSKVRRALTAHEPVYVVCSNVLNVIDDDETVQKISSRIEYIVTATGGRAFITVYEGNKTGIGKQTGKDQYQRNEKLGEYTKFFKNAVVYNGMIVVNSSLGRKM